MKAASTGVCAGSARAHLHVRVAVSDDTPICRRLRARGLHGGFGLVALEPVAMGAPVVEYVGEILTREQASSDQR